MPDLHTDFIYSVGAEEYGLVFSLLLISLFAFVVVRGLYRAMKLNDPFEQVAAAGLFVLVGQQAFINVAVNLNMIPTKGMTLPFISYGGSSMLAMGLTLGMALALTRRARRPPYERLAKDRRSAELPHGHEPRSASSPPAAPAATCSRPRPSPSALIARGWGIVLATRRARGGLRREAFPPRSASASRPAPSVAAIPSAWARRAWPSCRACCRRDAAFKRIDPAVVVGFGGYPSVPGLVAAITTGRPTVLHEQNAVMGRANRADGRPASPPSPAPSRPCRRRPAVSASALTVVGNPVRPEIRALAEIGLCPARAGRPAATC